MKVVFNTLDVLIFYFDTLQMTFGYEFALPFVGFCVNSIGI